MYPNRGQIRQVSVKQYISWEFYIILEYGLDFFYDDQAPEIFLQGKFVISGLLNHL